MSITNVHFGKRQKNYCRPRSEASEGYVFTGVCHSFCSTGRGVVTPNASWDRHMVTGGRSPSPPPWPGHPPPLRKERSLTYHTPLPISQPTYGHYGECESGRYASYWIAFLFYRDITVMTSYLKCHRTNH